MAVKCVVLVLNICILFNICNCAVSPYEDRPRKYDSFDWKAFNAISKATSENIITSPFAFKLFLTLLREAAEGKTRFQIESLLSTDIPRELNGLGWFEKVISSLEEKSDLYELNSATKVFLDKDLTPTKAFTDTIEKYFHAKTQTIDFKDIKHAAEEINAWSSDNTKGIIKGIVTEKQLKNASSVLANALYFKGEWERHFDKTLTKKMPFLKNDGKFVQASMMNKQDSAYFLETSKLGNGAKLLRLPYKGGKFAITFILPNDRNGLNKLIANIKPGLIGELQKELRNVTVKIFIPKFKFQSKISFKDTLQALNIKQIFTNEAQLPGFGPHHTALNDVIQKAGIEVDEKGTEIAVVTAGISSYRPRPGLPPPSIPTFRADHPFAFFIEEGTSGALLFAGKVFDPTSN